MSDYNIHIHLPQLEAPTNQDARGHLVDDFLRRVNKCHDWRSLYILGKEFPKIGLAVAETPGSNKILCKLVDGKPIAERIVDDYIFLGTTSDYIEAISPRNIELICSFIAENCGPAQALEPARSQHYTINPALYGKPIITNALCTEEALREGQLVEFIASKIL